MRSESECGGNGNIDAYTEATKAQYASSLNNPTLKLGGLYRIQIYAKGNKERMFMGHDRFFLSGCPASMGETSDANQAFINSGYLDCKSGESWPKIDMVYEYSYQGTTTKCYQHRCASNDSLYF